MSIFSIHCWCQFHVLCIKKQIVLLLLYTVTRDFLKPFYSFFLEVVGSTGVRVVPPSLVCLGPVQRRKESAKCRPAILAYPKTLKNCIKEQPLYVGTSNSKEDIGADLFGLDTMEDERRHQVEGLCSDVNWKDTWVLVLLSLSSWNNKEGTKLQSLFTLPLENSWKV